MIPQPVHSCRATQKRSCNREAELLQLVSTIIEISGESSAIRTTFRVSVGMLRLARLQVAQGLKPSRWRIAGQSAWLGRKYNDVLQVPLTKGLGSQRGRPASGGRLPN